MPGWLHVRYVENARSFVRAARASGFVGRIWVVNCGRIAGLPDYFLCCAQEQENITVKLFFPPS